MRKILLVFIAFSAFAACRNNKSPTNSSKSNYFDVQSYFDGEAVRLNTVRPELTKMVSINDSSETRHVKIADWKKELAVFSAGDIKKVSWAGKFTVSKKGDTITYQSNNEKVPVKLLQIIEKNARVLKISMEIVRKNILFTSIDHLVYYPDSLYEIKRQQNIKLLHQKKYVVLGRFN